MDHQSTCRLSRFSSKQSLGNSPTMAVRNGASALGERGHNHLGSHPNLRPSFGVSSEMEITGTLVLAADTVLLPVDQLSDELRRQVQAAEGDYAVMRRNSRTLARIVGGDAARLLEEFRQPTAVVQAVIRYCGATREDPET